MRTGFLLLLSIFFFAGMAQAQYAPLPPLDKKKFDGFVSYLKEASVEHQLPELANLADSMNYEDARQFMLTPEACIQKLRAVAVEKKEVADPTRLGLVINLLADYLSNLGDNGWETEFKIGYAIGVYAMFRVGEVYLMPELLYMHRVGKLEYDQYSNSVIQLNYITLVTTLLYAFNTGQPRWYIGLGPIVSVGLSGKEELTNNGQTRKFDLEFDDNGIERWSWGIGFRAGLIFRNSMMTYLGYNLMLSKVYVNSKWRMQTVVMGLAIPFSVFE
jgi:hypothetical protein